MANQNFWEEHLEGIRGHGLGGLKILKPDFVYQK